VFSDVDVANYFLSKDSDKTLFTTNLMERNGRTFYDGNARLNKYLHLAQNIYIAMTGNQLIDTDFYAYDNGAVSLRVMENYAVLLSRVARTVSPIKGEAKEFLDRFYLAFQSATLDELIDLSHEDIEWQENHTYFDKPLQKMDSMKHADEYKKQYADIIKVMYRLNNA
jgi:uncharacterized phage-associated protein